MFLFCSELLFFLPLFSPATGFAPVAPSAAEYYNVTGDMIDMFPLVGMAVNVPGLITALFCVDKFGIKVGAP